MKTVCFFLLCMLIGFSCRESRRILSSEKEFIGSEITIPQKLVSTFNGRDTVMNSLSQPNAKMVVWYDSTGCSSCHVNRLYEWEELLTYSKALRNKFQIVFVMTPKIKELESIRFSLMTYEINHPVLIDTAAYFATANPLVPTDNHFHTFLLDHDNKVVLAGTPTDNESLMKRYKKMIKALVNNKE